MTGRGPNRRRERARDAAVLELLPSTGKRYGRPLPKDVLTDKDGNPAEWHPQTVAWWNAIRAWPLMENEPAVAWSYLVDVALLHHAMWSRGRVDLAGEIRLRLAKFGATRADREKLRVTVLTPGDETGPASKAAGTGDQAWRDARRSRLLGNETPPA